MVKMLDFTKWKIMSVYSGEIVIPISGKIRTRCRLTMTYFPFDNQACYIEFTLVNYHQDYAYFADPFSSMDDGYLQHNSQWIFTEGKELVHFTIIY